MTERVAAPRRKKAHPAASARVLTAGISVSAGMGIVAMLALAAPSTAASSEPELVESGTDPTTLAVAPTAPTIVVRRYVPVPVAAPPATAAPAPTAAAKAGGKAANKPKAATPAASSGSSGGGSSGGGSSGAGAPTPAVTAAPKPAASPAPAAAKPKPAPKPTPSTVSKGS